MTPELAFSSGPGLKAGGHRLGDLVTAMGASRVLGFRDVEILSLALDSRMVTPGAVFFAVPGRRLDGAAFAHKAVERGARAVVAARPLPAPVPVVVVPDVQAAAADAARAFHHAPSSILPVAGITGTNGKTTVATFLHRILVENGVPAGLLATTGHRIGRREIPASRTTPDALQVQGLLREMVDQRQRAGVLEVSSHALDQKRVRGVDFAVAVITNLTHDHLDYHGSMEAYREAKLGLFRCLRPGSMAVVPTGDPVGKAAAEAVGPGVRVFTFGMEKGADFTAEIRRMTFEGTLFDLKTPQGCAQARLCLPGAHNTRNALAAAAAAQSLGLGTLAIASALEQCVPPRGRLEPVGDAPFRVLVDYAHTPRAVEEVCSALRPLTDGRLLVLVGCGGDRDATKRAPMGEAVARAADLAFFTSDNPRSEDPEAIMDAMEAGFRRAATACRLERDPDRRRAIERILRLARPGDTVLLAGKGHETCQEVEGRMIPFDDRAVVEELL